MKDNIYKLAPHWFQEFMIGLYNKKAYKKRYGSEYKKFLTQFKERENLSLEELKKIQSERYSAFLLKAVEGSSFYKKMFGNIEGFDNINNIKSLPIIHKEVFRKNIDDIVTIPESEGNISKTGGTTGKSLKVVFTLDNMQERFAMLDNFRGRTGYELGKRTAWFSGKAILTDRDVQKNRFWKTDKASNVRYYSTFHMNGDFIEHYLADMKKFKPEYLVGFPSTICEIARYGANSGVEFPKGIVKAVFPTAETVTEEVRSTIENYFHTEVYDQYASSEGAPFIFECPQRELHLELQSGVFEVLDDNDQDSNYGRLIVTAFTTEGTPLIRYDIGDMIELKEGTCTCGNNNPLVNQILGRIDDYVYSPQIGKINLGNVSNSLKNTYGIALFQVVQNELDKITINMVIDDKLYTDKVERIFLSNWRDRVGQQMQIELKKVEDIPVEKSGKFRMVKNNIKHLLS